MKLNDLTVISRVLTVKLTPPFVVWEVRFVDLRMLFVILTFPSVNSLSLFVISNGSVRRKVEAVREIDFANRCFGRFAREIFCAAHKSFRRIRALDVHANRIKRRRGDKT